VKTPGAASTIRQSRQAWTDQLVSTDWNSGAFASDITNGVKGSSVSSFCVDGECC